MFREFQSLLPWTGELLDQASAPPDAETRKYSQGAEVLCGGVHYRTWTEHNIAEVIVFNEEEEILRTVPLRPEGDGYFSGFDQSGRAGDIYKYKLDQLGPRPDPASRFQPYGVHGASSVVDPSNFVWSDGAWTPPRLADLVIYELHIGTFTPAGTYSAIAAKLDHLTKLGVTAIELMPIADFPGKRNWGYDGVMLYAPARAYGCPDDLRALVNVAHARGIAVILDVVYNHLGPDGNYLGLYNRNYFHPRHTTPWGSAFDFQLAPVRDFFVQNISYWMREFHIDGFRLDATHAIEDDSDTHILTDIAATAHREGGFVIIEDERKDPTLVRRPEQGGLGVDACWADDFHHVVRVMLTGEKEGYYAKYEGTDMELASTLTDGRLFGQQKGNRHEETIGHDIAPEAYVYCISNHDQVGNRAFGDRLNHVVSAAAYRAASAFFCLCPYTPLLFMGQEWGASAPFQFFTDHNPDLGERITKGRRREFRDFAAFAKAGSLETIPDPQHASTCENSKLAWAEIQKPGHAAILQLYREVLRLRRFHPAMQNKARKNWQVIKLEHGVIAIIYGAQRDCRLAVVTALRGHNDLGSVVHSRLETPTGRGWTLMLSSNEGRFGGDENQSSMNATTLVLESVRCKRGPTSYCSPLTSHPDKTSA